MVKKAGKVGRDTKIRQRAGKRCRMKEGDFETIDSENGRNGSQDSKEAGL